MNHKFARLLFAIVILCFAGSDAFGKRMSFTYQYNGGNCNDCEFLVADGTIEDDSVDDLRNMSEGGLVYINSDGGSLLGALALGNEFRKRHFRTIVGKTVRSEENKNAFMPTVGGVCESACAYAFLGGVERQVPPGAKFGIHAFSSEAEPGGSASFSAADISNVQILMGVLLEYTQRMGADPILVKLASEQPQDSMYFLTQEEIEKFNVNWNPIVAPEPQLEIYKNGLVASTKTSDGSATVTLFCRAGRLNLMLTTGGEDVVNEGEQMVVASDDWSAMFSEYDYRTRRENGFSYRTLVLGHDEIELLKKSGRFRLSYGVVRGALEATRVLVSTSGLGTMFAVLSRNCL